MWIYILSLVLSFLVLIFLCIFCIESYKSKYGKENDKQLIEKNLYYTSICAGICIALSTYNMVTIISIALFLVIIISIILKIFGGKFLAKIISKILAISIILSTSFYAYVGVIYMITPSTPCFDALELATYNSKFLQYEGDFVKGSTVNNLLKTVVTNNMSQDDEARQVEVNFENFDEGEIKDHLGNNVTKIFEDGKEFVKVSYYGNYKVVCNIQQDNKKPDRGLVNYIVVTKISNSKDKSN